MQKNELKLGVYEHYKGHKYLVIGQAKHSETMEDMVVYVCLYENTRTPQHLWVRPLELFFAEKEVDGQKVPAFKYVGGY